MQQVVARTQGLTDQFARIADERAGLGFWNLAQPRLQQLELPSSGERTDERSLRLHVRDAKQHGQVGVEKELGKAKIDREPSQLLEHLVIQLLECRILHVTSSAWLGAYLLSVSVRAFVDRLSAPDWRTSCKEPPGWRIGRWMRRP